MSKKDFETIKKELLEKGKKQGELIQEEIVDALQKQWIIFMKS